MSETQLDFDTLARVLGNERRHELSWWLHKIEEARSSKKLLQLARDIDQMAPITAKRFRETFDPKPPSEARSS